jgi:superfamily II DNA or RNA helicase
MTYKLFEIPSESGEHADVVLADASSRDRNAYTHLAYTIETTDSENSVLERRGIRFKSLRDWKTIQAKFRSVLSRLKENRAYYPGESVLEENELHPKHHIKTVLRLGALELLANIYSGRITASDKDPFPHQLALQQYVKNHESRIKRLLIADEVGLGKTIEVGLILRDKLIALGLENFRCLYLTSGGLREDVKEKLRSVIKDSGEESLISVVDSFRDYGDPISSKGIRIASMHAARLYLDDKSKKELTKGVKPNILIIDECHHCASNADLNGQSVKDASDTTQAYKAAYQMITGKFWQESEPPELVILMSATPFRSANQFTNLLRLLAHQTAIKDAYTQEIGKEQLLKEISQNESPVTVIWRQQDEIRSWSNERLFPKLTIIRPHREGEPRLERTDDEYLSTLEKIKGTVQRIYREHKDSFGGFATAHLETRLTSSSLAGACWLFRWCVRHHPKWQSEKVYKADNSDSTKSLRQLIREISRQLSKFDPDKDGGYAQKVAFPSDGNFIFKSGNLQDGNIPAIYAFYQQLHPRKKPNPKDNDDEDTELEATPEEILELTQLALDLLESGRSVENAKLNWLGAMLEAHPDSRFLVFTEVLQTTAIITATFPNQSVALTGGMSSDERKEVVKKFYDHTKNYRILVATSAADEGLDFQVANKVVHWDLSPDPAILMQRNGRVARLGQVSDVTAYYLILEGTLAEKRDTALLDRLTQAGVEEPRMQLKILGQLDSKQEEKITEAINKDDIGAVEQVLQTARRASEVMEEELRQLKENEQLKPQWVLDRGKLHERLKLWHDLQVTEYDTYKHKLAFETKEWNRPVFGEEKTEMKADVSEVLVIQRSKNEKYIKYRFIFDPEFALFSQEKNINGLAGLSPWYTKEKEGEVKRHQPFTDFDLIGSLSQSLARQRQADFMAVSAQKLCGKFPELKGCSYLLFATHPLRELEKDIPSDTAKYLTYYAFSNNFNQPVNLNGASADDVHEMISFLENQTIQDGILLSSGVINQAKSAGQAISGGLQTSLSMDEGFLDEESSYFAPIPVALIAIVDTNLEATEANSEIIHEKFVELASQWTQDVEVMSSTVEMTKHPAYQEIVSMGQAVIPFLLEDLSQNPLLRQRSSRNRL